MRIEIVNVGQEEAVQKYKQFEVVYKDENNSIKSKKLVSFSNPEVYSAIKKAQKGDVFEIGVEKDGKYYQWVSATSALSAEYSEKKTYSGSGKTETPKGNWETAEERTANRVKIIRQSALNYAVQLVGPKGDINKVFEYAAQFEQWVNRSDAPSGIQAIINMPDDLVD